MPEQIEAKTSTPEPDVDLQTLTGLVFVGVRLLCERLVEEHLEAEKTGGKSPLRDLRSLA